MKPLHRFVVVSMLLASSALVSAQLLPEQRLHDFQNLVALYSKRYAPYAWKNVAFGFNMFDTKPWIDRIRAAKDDLEYLEISEEYVASLRDVHSSFQITSNFSATLGILVDIYDGKVLIDSINRTTLPVDRFPFQVGDELVSLDGKTAEEWIARISKYRSFGNAASARRLAAGQITSRSQATFPRAHEIGDSATVEIRRADGTVESHTIPWTKTGTPITKLAPVPFYTTLRMDERAAAEDDLQRALAEAQNWALPAHDAALQVIPWTVDEGAPRSYVLGLSARNPVFLAGLPSNFVRRLGGAAADFHYSGTFQVEGVTIGYLRIPNFSPLNIAQAITELNNELTYFERNTQGLVLDVMRNGGGGCYMLDAAARFMSSPFYFFGEQVRPTIDRRNLYENLLNAARNARAEQWVVDTYQNYLGFINAAMQQTGALTGPIAACTQTASGWAPVMFGNLPAPVVYTKPMIILVDEFSISAADIFPAMLQDNGRGVVVGMRTSGGGGSTSGWPAGIYGETTASNTNSLVVRKNPIVTQDLPTAAYVENIGVRPEITLDYMTRDNLTSGGRAFVNRFAEIIVEQIRKAP